MVMLFLVDIEFSMVIH